MLFKGEHLNSDTGLYYMRARYYDPVTGAFTSKDPVEGYLTDPQTFNGYSYALNDPVNLADPSGEDTYGLETTSEVETSSNLSTLTRS